MTQTPNFAQQSHLAERLAHTRRITAGLCAPLEIEDYIPQAAPFVSPPKWHLAHTTWFFEEMILKQHMHGYQIYDAHYGFLFNSYYQSVGRPAERSERGLITRPTVADVTKYRAHVDAALAEFCNGHISDDVAALIELGINHEQQHQELLVTDLKYTFSHNPTYPVYSADLGWERATDRASEAWLTITPGTYQIGAAQGFCFDNEQPRHQALVHACEISKNLVTNGEYLEFIEAGGYQEFQHWLDDGWEWVCSNNIEHPEYWLKGANSWSVYTLEGRTELTPDAPVSHISYYEAAAYASWRDCRLPTEFEWEAACAEFDWGRRWEWTSSSYQAYPKFQISDDAIGEYNGKFMVNQMVLRGASDATAAGHSRPSYRNFFHPHLRWQLTGIRLANDI